MPQEPLVKGSVGFEVRVPIDVADMRTWSPERGAAFFNGLANALAAAAAGGSIQVQLPTQLGTIAHIDGDSLLYALEKFVRERTVLPLPEDVEQQRSGQARDMLVAVMQAHHARCVNPDCIATVSMVAFIAHSLGMRSSDNLGQLREMLVQYESNCPGCTPLN